MATGIEIAGLVLAAFPVIISLLEHSGEGYEFIRNWSNARTDFQDFKTDFIRSKILFRQHIEVLLSPVIDNDGELAYMLEHPDDSRWKGYSLEIKLRERLSGKDEYENLITTIANTADLLQETQGQIDITDPESGNGLDANRALERLLFVLTRGRREELLSRLEKNNDEMNQLLGNINRLEPTRQKRKTSVPNFYEKFRRQAISLHRAIEDSLRCRCLSLHSSTLLLWDTEESVSVTSGTSSSNSLKLKIYFPRQLRRWSGVPTVVGLEHDWYASEIVMAKADRRGQITQNETVRSRSNCMSDESPLPRAASSQNTSSQSRYSLHPPTRFISSENDNRIHDLCHALQESDTTNSYLGYLIGEEDYLHKISRSSGECVLSTSTRRIATLGDLIEGPKEDKTPSGPTEPKLCREKRLGIALKMTKVLLQLYSSPWLGHTWCKDDIHFFEDKSGAVRFDIPFLVTNFNPSVTDASLPPANITRQQRTRATLLSLGILILELWFNKSIDSCPWLGDYLGPDGCRNEHTLFITAIRWQEQALEEGGMDLHNVTTCCIYGSFGIPIQDLGDRELQNAVYSKVVEPLERILARYKML